MPTTNQDLSPEGKLPQFDQSAKESARSGEGLPEEEASIEQAAEKPIAEKAAEAAGGAAATPITVVLPKAAPAPVLEKDPELVEIENILSEGLENLYKDLPDNRKVEFKQQGEATAKAVQTLLRSAKVKVKKIVDIIVKWLRMIPGVNKFFLEQESKIKADKLLELKKEQEEGRR